MAEFERLHVGNSEGQEKQSIAFDFAQTATVGLAATGVLTGLVVNQTATASGSVVIGAGAGVVGSTVGAGASEAINPGDVTVNVFGANPVGGLPRNDIMVWDSTTKLFAVVVGTPNATPSDPSVSATQLKLGRLRHAASATTIPIAKIDDLRVLTGLRGVTIPVASQAQRDALAAFDGLQVYRTDLHLTETYNGTRWTGAVQTYTPVVTGITAGTSPVTGSYVERGKTVTGTIVLTLNATSVMTGLATFTLPFTALNASLGLPAGAVLFSQTAGTSYAAMAVISGGTVIVGIVGSAGILTPFTSTTPFAWSVGSTIAINYTITIA